MFDIWCHCISIYLELVKCYFIYHQVQDHTYHNSRNYLPQFTNTKPPYFAGFLSHLYKELYYKVKHDHEIA